MFKRPQYIALIAAVVLVLIVLSLPTQTATHLKLALGGFFLPLIGVASSARALTDRAADELLPRRALLNRMVELRQENERLRIDLLQSNAVWQENGKLRQAIGWQQQTSWKGRWARVVLRDPANWWRTIQIDLGLRDGAATNMPVLTIEGLVGKIDQVGFHSSRVVLIGDPNCEVSAVVENTQDDGVIQADSLTVIDPSIVQLTFLGGQSAAKPGAQVFTSGLGGVYPPGIPIGKIVETNSVSFGMYTEARVKLAANLRHLEHVWVKYP